MSKIGLIVEGGGMKCAYSAGVLDKFLDNNIEFDYTIGISAGSANAASYLAGQRGRNLRFYTTHIHDDDYFGLKPFIKTGNLFGLQYIYKTLSNSDGKDPLDYEHIVNNPSEFVIVATNARTGKPHYFTKDEIQKDNYIQIMASSALPAACRTIKIDGEKYFDGGVSDSLPIDKAIEDGCDKIVVISSKPRNFVKTPEKGKLLYTILCHRYPKIIELLNNRHINYTKAQKKMYDLEKEGKVFVFAPSKSLPMDTYAMDADKNMDLYKLGLSDFDHLENELYSFMNLKTHQSAM